MRKKRTRFVTDKISKSAPYHNRSAGITKYVISQKAPCKIHSEEMHFFLWPHEFCSGKADSEDPRHECEDQILEYGNAHAEHKEVKNLIYSFCQFGMFFFKSTPNAHPFFFQITHFYTSLLLTGNFCCVGFIFL